MTALFFILRLHSYVLLPSAPEIAPLVPCWLVTEEILGSGRPGRDKAMRSSNSDTYTANCSSCSDTLSKTETSYPSLCQNILFMLLPWLQMTRRREKGVKENNSLWHPEKSPLSPTIFGSQRHCFNFKGAYAPGAWVSVPQASTEPKSRPLHCILHGQDLFSLIWQWDHTSSINKSPVECTYPIICSVTHMETPGWTAIICKTNFIHS